jgi:uncharacterized protein HemY
LNLQQDDAVQDQDALNDIAAEAHESVDAAKAVQLNEADSVTDEVAHVDLREALATVELEMTPTGEQRPRSRHERLLRSLNRAIEEHPDSPTNYVLRGELALETKDYGQAIDDFEQALELAAAQVETNRWGFVAQTMQDRAFAGLTRARRLGQMKVKRIYSDAG